MTGGLSTAGCRPQPAHVSVGNIHPCPAACASNPLPIIYSHQIEKNSLYSFSCQFLFFHLFLRFLLISSFLVYFSTKTLFSKTSYNIYLQSINHPSMYLSGIVRLSTIYLPLSIVPQLY